MPSRPQLSRLQLSRPNMPSRPSLPTPPPFFARRLLAILGVVAVVAGIAAGGYFGGRALFDSDSDSEVTSSPGPPIVIHRSQPQAAQDVGFPAFATKDTTRVGGADPAADAAGVALAVYPSATAEQSPPAVTLVPDDDWQAGVAAASLMAPPIGAPILISSRESVPPLTADALAALAPAGSAATDRKQLFVIGGASAPAGATSASVEADDPAKLAVGIATFRQKLVNGPPDALLLASSEAPAYAMPAAAWAARSGDPVLYLERDSVPVSTLAALKRYPGLPTFVLGPPSVVSGKALAAVKKIAPQAKRISAADPVASAVAFARYSDGGFGWDVNDPGHGFVIASTSRPLDAAAAAALSASGTWGPLLVTDDAAAPPTALRNYLLDLKPGYAGDPTRAVYNHVWLVGDESAISVPFQAEVDDLAEVAEIKSGTGAVGGPTGSETETQKKP